MDNSSLAARRARIIGVGLMAAAAGVASGRLFWDRFDEGRAARDVAGAAGEELASVPNPEPVPRRRIPLTLANQPQDSGAGVVNADYKEPAH